MTNSYDEFDLEAKEKQRKEAAEKVRRRATQEIDALRWLMKDRRGRMHMHTLLTMCGVFRSSFNRNAIDMGFNEGMRDIGLRMTKLLTDHCFEHYQLMMKEGIEND